MAKQSSKTKKAADNNYNFGNFGKGKITPVQIAFIVDRYLSDNNFHETRSTFRSEASSLISKSPLREAPKSLLSLGDMLDEYICLKEQKVMVDQEKCRLEQEKWRVQKLLHGMQDVMDVYNYSSGSTPLPMPTAMSRSMVLVPRLDQNVASPAAGTNVSFSRNVAYGSYTIVTTDMNYKSAIEFHEVLTPTLSCVRNPPRRTRGSGSSTSKRKSSNVVSDAPDAKKLCTPSASKQLPTEDDCSIVPGPGMPPQFSDALNSQDNVQQYPGAQSPTLNNIPIESSFQKSGVAKSLFNQPSTSPPTKSSSSGPKTPPQSCSSQSDKSTSPLEISSNANSVKMCTSSKITPQNCTIISSETAVMVSPCKQKAYYVERNHCVSSPVTVKRLSKRDHVKGRLDFDGSDAPTTLANHTSGGNLTSEPNKDGEIFDMDFSNLDIFGPDFSFADLLGDFDIGCKELSCTSQQEMGASDSSVPWSPNGAVDDNQGKSQILSKYSSTVTEVLAERDMMTLGSDTLTSVKSITKCIRILSPGKSQRSSSLDPENLTSSG
ncbi:hypothetical protein RJ641_028434 [Dillenia turbinata]|uniref:Uncharacterized protein n=1 Tax=Dillenia turbinata TaxID=194707 RepID=A0AAN8W7H0_9MAGN